MLFSVGGERICGLLTERAHESFTVLRLMGVENKTGTPVQHFPKSGVVLRNVL